MEKATQISINQTPYNLPDLYDEYAGMLLGYIFEIVRDIKLAEQHLVHIYNKLPLHFAEVGDENGNTWCHLQRLAKKHLSGIMEASAINNGLSATDMSVYYARNKFIALMTPEQQQVFCYVYYHGKSTAQLAKQLDKTEDWVRRVLKEAFTIIKGAK